MTDFLSLTVNWSIILLAIILVGVLLQLIPNLIAVRAFNKLKKCGSVDTVLLETDLTYLVKLVTPPESIGISFPYETSLMLADDEVVLTREVIEEVYSSMYQLNNLLVKPLEDAYLVDKVNPQNGNGTTLITVGNERMGSNPKFVIIPKIRMGDLNVFSTKLTSTLGGDLEIDTSRLHIIRPGHYTTIKRPSIFD